jgi:hypothetical protein
MIGCGLIRDYGAHRVEQCVSKRSSCRTVVEDRGIGIVLKLECRAGQQVVSGDYREANPASQGMLTGGYFIPVDGCSPAAGQDAESSGAKERFAGHCVVDLGDFGGQSVQSGVDVRVLGDQRSVIVVADYEDGGVLGVERVVEGTDFVQGLEGVVFYVHSLDGGDVVWSRIQGGTGCRRVDVRFVQGAEGGGNLFPHKVPSIWQFSILCQLASDASAHAEQKEHLH